MRSVLLRLVTYVPALLLAMVLTVLGLNSAQAQQGAVSSANPFAEPQRSPMLDAPLPQAAKVNLPPPMPVESQVNLDSLSVEFIVGSEAVLKMAGQNQGTASRTYHVYHGEPVLISGRKFNVEVVRELVRLYDADGKKKTNRGEIAWSGSVGGIDAGHAGSAMPTAQASQIMFAGTNIPSPSIKAVSSYVQYGAPGMTGVGGIGGMGGAVAAQGNASQTVQR